MYDGGWMTDKITYVHAASLSDDSYQKIAATGGTVSVATESEQSAGQGYPSTWRIRKYGIPTSLSMDTSVWWSADFFSAMRATLSAFRSRDHLESQAQGETGQRQPAPRRGRRVAGDDGRRAHARHDRQARLAHTGQEGRRRAAQERRVARDDADPQPLRPCRLPGRHGRRAHRRRQRQGREVRRTPDRDAARAGARQGRGIRRVRPRRAGRSGVGRVDAPADPRGRDDPEPVHLPGRGASSAATRCGSDADPSPQHVDRVGQRRARRRRASPAAVPV